MRCVFLVLPGHNLLSLDEKRPDKPSLQDLINLQQKIAPETKELVLFRYRILAAVQLLQPVGRRSLAEYLKVPERRVRREVDFCKEKEWVKTLPGGMVITQTGESLLRELGYYVRLLQGLNLWEEELVRIFGLKKAIIIPGDLDRNTTVKKELAGVTADYLRGVLKDGSILAVTGGTTLSEVARALESDDQKREITVIPARGGLGEEVEIQANTIAATVAKGLGASYRLLHAPDDLSPEASQSMLREPKVREILGLLRQADLLMHGIGTAGEMAERRGMRKQEIEDLLAKGAVGEAFGYYFNYRGEVIYATSSVGLQLEELPRIKEVLAVGGGKSKASAIISVLSQRLQQTLITDEGAAGEVLRILSGQKAESK